MNKYFSVLFERHTDIMVEQTRTKPQETLEFKMNGRANAIFLV